MLHRLFLPLSIAALLGNAAAANNPKAIHTPRQASTLQCAISAQRAGHDGLPARDASGDTVIGGLSRLPHETHFAARGLDLSFANQPDRGNLRPYVVAALEMKEIQLSGGTPTTCYPALSLATTSVPAAKAGASYSVT